MTARVIIDLNEGNSPLLNSSKARHPVVPRLKLSPLNCEKQERDSPIFCRHEII